MYNVFGDDFISGENKPYNRDAFKNEALRIGFDYTVEARAFLNYFMMWYNGKFRYIASLIQRVLNLLMPERPVDKRQKLLVLVSLGAKLIEMRVHPMYYVVRPWMERWCLSNYGSDVEEIISASRGASFTLAQKIADGHADAATLAYARELSHRAGSAAVPQLRLLAETYERYLGARERDMFMDFWPLRLLPNNHPARLEGFKRSANSFAEYVSREEELAR
jgi:hypothetical protein